MSENDDALSKANCLTIFDTHTYREKRLSNLFGATGGNHAGWVYDIRYLAPTLNRMGGGYREPIIVEVVIEDDS